MQFNKGTQIKGYQTSQKLCSIPKKSPEKKPLKNSGQSWITSSCHRIPNPVFYVLKIRLKSSFDYFTGLKEQTIHNNYVCETLVIPIQWPQHVEFVFVCFLFKLGKILPHSTACRALKFQLNCHQLPHLFLTRWYDLCHHIGHIRIHINTTFSQCVTMSVRGWAAVWKKNGQHRRKTKML